MGTALYIRVSTEMQEEHGVSLETQEETLEAYCKLKKLTDIRKYIDVGSARTTKRKEFQKMMNHIRQGKIKRVIILRLDRLTRSIVDLNKLIQEFNKYDCELHSATENIDTTSATGRMVINLIATFAQWESETISERVTVNMMTKARKGIWLGPSPFGYSKDKEGRLIINEREANILREAFNMILDGYSYSSTEKYIAEKYNLKWTDNYLRRKVRSQTIIGNIERKSELIVNTHEGIITKGEQKQLIARLEENKSGRTSIDSINNDLFRRKIKCYQCDNNLALATSYNRDGETYYYYRCNNCQKRGKKHVSVAENIMLQALKDYFNSILLDKIETVYSDNKSPVIKLKQRLDELEEERDRVQRAWIKKLMNDDDLMKYQTEIDEEQEKIERELEKYEEPTLTKNELKKIALTLKEGFDTLSKENQRTFIQRFIKRIEFKRTLVDGYKKKYDTKVTNVEFY